VLGDRALLSARSNQRLKARFELESEAWKKQDPSRLEVAHAWADGLYVKAGIEDRTAALLTIVGATANGAKVLLACESGERESKDTWLMVLRDLAAPGLQLAKVNVADAHLHLGGLGELHPGGAPRHAQSRFRGQRDVDGPSAAALLDLAPAQFAPLCSAGFCDLSSW
jgi:hypothetical protein